MSEDLQQYAPLIVERLDFTACDVYFYKYGIITHSEYESSLKAVNSGHSNNRDLVSWLLTKTFGKSREFYRALREYVTTSQHVHAGNKELFELLPTNFVSSCMGCNFVSAKYIEV